MTELGYDTRAAEMEMRLESILRNPDYQTLVAVSGGKVCGMIGCIVQHSTNITIVGARILALVVAEKMRGSGVGQRTDSGGGKRFDGPGTSAGLR